MAAHVCSESEGAEVTKSVLGELEITNATVTDLRHVHRICEVVSHRSASLLAAGRPRF